MPKDISLLICGVGLIGSQRLRAALDAGLDSKRIYALEVSTTSLVNLAKYQIPESNIFSNKNKLNGLNPTHVVVAMPHLVSTPIAREFLEKGCKVLLEKPLARTLREAFAFENSAFAQNLSLGFNYRFMAGIRKLRESLLKSELGEVISVKIELGHGGKPEDEMSWKLDPKIAGGGALIDPGIHILDLLVYLFRADEKNFMLNGVTDWKGFWQTGIEEIVYLNGKINNTIFQLSSSIVSWKTKFGIEVLGTDGYFTVSGRGRTDGPQIITKGKRWGWMTSNSQSESEISEMVMEKDNSIELETKSWLSGENSLCNVSDAITGMKLFDLAKNQLAVS
jgi:predicted dehydrogenase